MKRLHWDTVMWCVGIMNAVAILPQLVQIWISRETQGVSLVMFSIFVILQITFGINGWFRNDRGTMWGMFAAMLTSLAIIGSTLYLRA